MLKLNIHISLLILIASCGYRSKNTELTLQKTTDSLMAVERKDSAHTIQDTTKLPANDSILVVRTDFSDNYKWDALCKRFREPNEEYGFVYALTFVNNKKYQDFNTDSILHNIPSQYKHSYIFIIDKQTVSTFESPILCMDVKNKPGVYFRFAPSQLSLVETNLSIGNIDINEFVRAVDSDGVFRGFKEQPEYY